MKSNIIKALLILVAIWHLYTLLPVLLHTQAQNIGELKIYDRKEQLIAHLPQPDGFLIPLTDDEPIPENISRAFLTIEDERFYSHWGVDAIAKFRALRDNISSGKIVSGGSTITEQYLKNRYFPHSRRSIVQKLREATLAFYSSFFLSKEEVLRNYLDTIYFGNRNYGIKAAMKSYFDKSHLETLTDAELVTLLAIIRSPGVINTEEEYFQNRFARIAATLKLPESAIPELSLEPFSGFNRFPHVTAEVKRNPSTLSSRPSTLDPRLSSINPRPSATSIQTTIDHQSPTTSIHTTIDSVLQAKAKELINHSLTRLTGKNVTNGAVYVFQPSTGEILVWQGSADFHDESIDGQVNVITRRRQMGSALKPFIYLYAFTQGAHPDQLTVDLEKDFQTARLDEFYRPLNYGLREGGVMPLKLALANSFNIASVRLLDHLGLQKTYKFLKTLGLDFDQDAEHYGLSLALGSPDLTMKNVADAYGLLAQGLRQPKPDSRPSTIDQLPRNRRGRLPAIPLFHLFETLSNPLNRSRSFGSNSILNTSTPFAVKTGTTRNFHDNWTFGYHPDLVVATWVGNNDNSPMVDVDGITGAGPIWHRMVEAVIEAGYVLKNSQPEAPNDLVQFAKCLNIPCSRTELIYQEPDREWFSDLEAGHYCLEDFFIRDIEEGEIVKMAKLFDFADFSISWCLTEAGRQPSDADQKPHTSDQQLSILKPQANEIFYIRRDIPLELQEIILKANKEVEWYLNEDRVGYDEILFIQPTIGKQQIKAKTLGAEETVEIEVRWAE